MKVFESKITSWYIPFSFLGNGVCFPQTSKGKQTLLNYEVKRGEDIHLIENIHQVYLYESREEASQDLKEMINATNKTLYKYTTYTRFDLTTLDFKNTMLQSASKDAVESIEFKIEPFLEVQANLEHDRLNRARIINKNEYGLHILWISDLSISWLLTKEERISAIVFYEKYEMENAVKVAEVNRMLRT